MNKLSIIIPTLQKNITNLNKLINILDKDEVVSEIIIIDNSTIGFSHNSQKVICVVPDKNLFVNPSWNLGVQKSQNEYFALFNDDLVVCENFCSKVMNLISDIDDFVALGMANESVINTNIPDIPPVTDFCIEEDLTNMENNWGCIIFGKKSSYTNIPEKIKIWCGDDFIRFNAKNQKLKVFKLQNAIVNHIGSLSISNRKIRQICRIDCIEYAKVDPEMKTKWAYKNALKKTHLYRIKEFFNQKKDLFC